MESEFTSTLSNAVSGNIGASTMKYELYSDNGNTEDILWYQVPPSCEIEISSNLTVLLMYSIFCGIFTIISVYPLANYPIIAC